MNEQIKVSIEKLFDKQIIDFKKTGGFTSDNFIVTFSNQEQVFLKILKNKTKEEILLVQNIYDCLKNTNLNFSYPIIKEGQTLFCLADSFCQFFPFIKGKVIHAPNLKQVHIQQIVNIIKQFESIPKNKLSLNNSYNLFFNLAKTENNFLELENFIKENSISNETDKVAFELLELKKELARELINDKELIYFVKDSFDFVHGDFHNENFLFQDENLIAVLDFELAHFGTKLEDIFDFVNLGCIANNFSTEDLTRASLFAKNCRQQMSLKFEEFKIGLDFLILKYAVSDFLERALYQTKDLFFLKLLQRDINKFTYLQQNKEKFLTTLFTDINKI